MEVGDDNGEEEDERMRLVQLNPQVVMEYLKSSIDIILGLKIEDELVYQHEFMERH